MKYLDEYRDAKAARCLAAAIERSATRPWTIMEVCGGQTHAIIRYGLDEILPRAIDLVHGPGCPVCVTSLETLDRAHAIAAQPGVIRHFEVIVFPVERKRVSVARLDRLCPVNTAVQTVAAFVSDSFNR